MNITYAEYKIINEYPYLRVIIDGKEAIIGNFKKSLLDLGYVPLKSREVAWETLLPKIHLNTQNDSEPIELKGFTNDPKIIELAKKYWKAINHLDGQKFEEGPITIS